MHPGVYPKRSPEGAQRIPGRLFECAKATMVNYRRNRIAGGTYFLTVNLENRRRSLLVEHIGLLRAALSEIRRSRPFRIDAMVVLPDHFHAVWTLPPGDADYARRVQLIKAAFTKQLVWRHVPVEKDRRGEFRLWQKRYWEHTIRDDRDFGAHVNYVHINPVKHGHVTRASDWLFSTIHHYVERGVLPADWACAEEAGNFGE